MIQVFLMFFFALISIQNAQATFLELIPNDVEFNSEGRFINPTQLSSRGYSFNLNKNFVQKNGNTHNISKDNLGRFIFSTGREVQPSKQFDLQQVFFNDSYHADQLTFCNGTKTKSLNPFKKDILRCQSVNQKFCEDQKSRVHNLFPRITEFEVFKVIEACKVRLIKENKVSEQCREYLGKLDTINEFSYNVLHIDQKKIEDKNQELLAAMNGASPSFKVVHQVSYVPIKNKEQSEYIRSSDTFINSFELCRQLTAIDQKSIAQQGLTLHQNIRSQPSKSSTSTPTPLVKTKKAQ